MMDKLEEIRRLRGLRGLLVTLGPEPKEGPSPLVSKVPVSLEQLDWLISEVERLRTYEGYHGIAHDYEQCKAEVERLTDELGKCRWHKAHEEADKEIDRLTNEIAMMKRNCWRKPTHGPCCTCQLCGHHYDDCKYDLDEAADEIERLTKRCEEARDIIEGQVDRIDKNAQKWLEGTP